MRRRLADERGSALTLFAVIAPVFILFLALALDVGNWFTHKRNLQNRADAAALAAGVQYTTNENADLIACKNGEPGNTAGTDSTSWAKKYAGDPGVAGSLNTQVANQGSLSISVNSSTFGGTDWSDAAGNTGSPCFFHPANASDFISPKGGYWTDVKVKETNIPTLFGAFGINVPAITARARLEVRAIGSINPFGPTIPFVGQSGDFVPCAWARFVDYQGNPLPAGQVGGTNPLPLGLVSGETREWEATMPTISTSGQNVDDIGVQAVLGFPQTAGNCNTPPNGNSATLPDPGDPSFDTGSDGSVDWINVYRPHKPVGVKDFPAMSSVWTTPSGCSTVGYVYSGTYPPTSCAITVHGVFDVGDQPGSAGAATLYVNDSKTGASVAMGPGAVVPGGGPVDGDHEWTANITLNPNATKPGSTKSQDFTEVGQHRFSFCWVKTSGSLNNQPPKNVTCGGVQGRGKAGGGAFNCGTGGANPVCTGYVEFLDANDSANSGVGTETWQQATYLYDPVYSDPLTKVEIVNNAGTPIFNSAQAGVDSIGGAGATIRVEELGLDTYRTTIIHDSVQGSGNRTGSADCGQGGGASGLDGAIEMGCPDQVQLNWRGSGPLRTYSCAGGDAPTASTTYVAGHTETVGVLDCLDDVTGNKTQKIRDGMNNMCVEKNYANNPPTCTRTLDCTTDLNHWDSTKPADLQNISLSDPRIRDVFMAPFGLLEGSGHYPVATLVAFYVTGWDGQSNACTSNEAIPRDYTGKGTSVWGHYMTYVDLTTGTNPSSDPCDLSASVILCKPTLVR